MAPDEVPYLLDLHLFLGRSLTLACPHEEPTGEWRLGGGWGPCRVSSWWAWGWGWGVEVGQAVLALGFDCRGRSLYFFFFSGLHLRHMEVPRLGVKSEL